MKFCCSEVPVRHINSGQRTSKGLSEGCFRSRSRTSTATSGKRDATTRSNFVFCTVIPRVVKVASTSGNHGYISSGENGRIWILAIRDRTLTQVKVHVPTWVSLRLASGGNAFDSWLGHGLGLGLGPGV